MTNSTSSPLSSSATLGLGSNVWEFVPSGTMPVILTRSPPMFDAMLVIGATVVPTARRPSAAAEPLAALSPQPAMSRPAAKIRPRKGMRQTRRKLFDPRIAVARSAVHLVMPT